MSKTFKQLKTGETIFLVGNPDFIAHEDLVENFGLFTIKTLISTLDGKQNPIVCLGGEFRSVVDEGMTKKSVAYFTAPEDYEITGHHASIRVDSWSTKFTRTISEYRNFLCFPDVESGLGWLENKFKKYLEDIKESREINNKALGK